MADYPISQFTTSERRSHWAGQVKESLLRELTLRKATGFNTRSKKGDLVLGLVASDVEHYLDQLSNARLHTEYTHRKAVSKSPRERAHLIRSLTNHLCSSELSAEIVNLKRPGLEAQMQERKLRLCKAYTNWDMINFILDDHYDPGVFHFKGGQSLKVSSTHSCSCLKSLPAC